MTQATFELITATGCAGSGMTYTYPYTNWNLPYASTKCQNCGYCSCCGKADIPGKLTEVPQDRENRAGGGHGDRDVHAGRT